jgi:glyoxylase-like metal-dependent hydrolase (beta-lactamase superfamily II)
MKFGDYECNPLDLGDFRVDGGAMFGIIPKTEWQTKVAVDAENRIRLKNRSLLIQGAEKNILVDTGFGNKLTPELKRLYGITTAPIDINLVLSTYNLDVYQITDVILSHLHLDHTGGSTIRIGNKVEPTFPNARYYVQSEQWEQACNPNERDSDSYLPDDFLPLNSHRQLQLIDGSITLFDGIELMSTYGHTVAQQHVVVKGTEQSLFFCADLIPTVTHIPVPWLMGYDNKPLDLFPEKDYFLRKAIREKWILFFEHDPEIAAATVKEGEKWIEFDKEIRF